MPIFKKSNPSQRTEKEKLKARQASFSPVDNARVAQLKTRSSNGFKGERLNDHGLPLGDNLGKEVPIIQSTSAETDNPESSAKFRKQKYAKGTQSVEVVDNPFKKNRSKSTNDRDKEGEMATASKVDKLTPVTPALAPVTSDEEMDKVVAETPVKSQSKSLSQIQDMEKVKQHQMKLNKYGANLKVDGMWGAKTEAASRDLYPKYKEGLSSLPGKSRFKQSTKVSTEEIGEKMMGKRNNEAETKTATPSKPDTRMSVFLNTKGTKGISDDVARRESRVADSMVGDPDMHRPALNRVQAEKLVDLEDKEDSKKSYLPQIVGGTLGVAAGAAGAFYLAKKGKTRAAAKALDAVREIEESSADAVVRRARSAFSKRVGSSVKETRTKVLKGVAEKLGKRGAENKTVFTSIAKKKVRRSN